MFKLQQTKNIEKSRTRQKLFVLSAGVATLVASGEALVPAVRNDKTFSSGDVSAEPTDENDDIVIGGTTGEAGVVATGYGDDKIVGGAKVDIIVGGAGKDNINGGAGLDILVVVGETSGGNYNAGDLQDLYGTGIDVSSVIDLVAVNAQTQSDVEVGETIDGGADNAHLYLLGKVNFFGVTLANISKIFMDKEIIISDDILQKLKSEGLTDIVGKGSIQAQIGKLDLDGVNVPPEVDILDSDGNIVVPVAAAGGLGATVELNENTTSVGNFTVTDESAVGLVTYKLEGADAALFKVDANGVVEFIAAPDFENAGDVGKDNVYDIKIVATDEHLKSVSQDVAIKVLDVQEEIIPPVFTPSEGLLVNMGENIASVATVTATDESAIIYSVGGVDAQFFAIDANTGVLTFIAAPDFETPLDVGADNIYSLNVVATDAAGNVATRSVTINIQDVDDVKPVFATQGKLLLSAAENQKAVGSTSASDAAAVTYSHSGGDSALFTVNATTGVIEFIAAPDFESPADAGANNVYEMTIAATDAFGNVATQAVEMTVTDVDENAPVFSNSALLVVGTLENNLGAGSVVATDESAITYSLAGVDESHFTISPTGKINFKNYPDFDAPKDDGADNIYNITAVATDAGGAFANREVKITVNEADPILTVKNELVRKGSEFLVNTEAGGGQGLAEIATLVNGNIVATWSSSVAVDDGDAYAVKWQLFSPSGEKIGIEHLANTTVVGFQYYSNVTALESGGFTIAWSEVIIDGGGVTTAANVYGQVYSETGDKVGAQIQLNTSDTSFQLNPVLTSLSNGGFVAIWTTVDAAQDGAGGAVMGQMFNLLGVKVGLEFVVNQQTAGDQIAYSVTTLKNGNIVATWETTTTPQDGDGKAIKARVFDSKGLPITLLDIQVNSETVGHQINPSVAALGSGGFVVGWVTEDDNQDGSNSAIKLQLFTANGIAVTEKLVNSEHNDAQSQVNVEALANGGFLLTWTSLDGVQDTSETSVKGQIYDDAGTKIGGEFLVNAKTSKSQDSPASTGLLDGGFVTIWATTDETQDGSSGAVKGQIYEYAPVHKYEANKAYNFEINIKLDEIQGEETTITNIQITDIPAGVTFSEGVQVGGTLTLLPTQLDGLQINIGAGINGGFTPMIEVHTSDDAVYKQAVAIAVGELRIGQDAVDNLWLAENSVEHYDGAGGEDNVVFTSPVTDFSFAISGQDLAITNNNSGNTSYFHSIELLGFTDGLVVSDDVVTSGHLTVPDNFDFAEWVVSTYDSNSQLI